MAQPVTAPRVRSGWYHSLYVRALVVMLLGSGALMIGAWFHSSVVEDLFEERLGAERTALARAVGGGIERRLVDTLDNMAAWGRALLQAGSVPAGPVPRPRGVMFENAILLFDARGRLVWAPDALSVPGDDLAPVLALARERLGPTAAGLARPGRPTSLAIATPVRDADGEVLGFAAALPSPASVERLLPRYPPTGGVASPGSIQLVDGAGRILAASGGDPGTVADHGSLLAKAVHDRKPLYGRCHRCHEEDDGPVPYNEVLAFAPLEALDLGVTVRQLESEALGDVLALRRALLVAALALVSLFILAGGLAVAATVRPVTRLAHAVRSLGEPGAPQQLPSLGKSEVGELSTVLEAWRSRLAGALEVAENSRAALHEEVKSSTRLLQALFSITAASLEASRVEAIVEHGLDRLLEVLDFRAGALRLVWHSKSFDAVRGDVAPAVPQTLGRLAEALAADGPASDGCRARTVEPGELGAGCPTAFLADLSLPGGPRVTAMLCGPAGGPVEDRRLHALLHHIRVSAANVLLKEEELEGERLRREYLRSVLAAQEDERRRIARELHDTVAQDLAALRLALERLSAPGRAVPEELRALEERAHEMLDTVRRITLDLRPAVLDAMGFLPALQWHFERVQREHGLRGAFNVDGEPVDLDKDLAVRLFRIFQECMQNVVQHAQAEHVFVTVGYEAHRITLTTEDDGVGFDPQRLHPRPDEGGRGLGLLGMEERAKILGGSVVLDTAPGEGTTVRVEVPLKPVRPAEGVTA